MKLKKYFIVVSIILGIQSISNLAAHSGRSLYESFRQICKNNDHIEIDFDVLDKELALLPIEEKESRNSWWITKQTKHFMTKMMIKTLLGYIALQEYCNKKWDSFSKTMRKLRIYCNLKVQKLYHDFQEL